MFARAKRCSGSGRVAMMVYSIGREATTTSGGEGGVENLEKQLEHPGTNTMVCWPISLT